MPSFIAAVVVAVALAVGAAFVLNGYQKPVEQAFQSSGVRL
jgi:hypothetical protein